MKRVYSAMNLAAVHHARNVLESVGIQAVVKNELLSSAMGELPPAECQVEVWVVHDTDEARANEVLRAMRRGAMAAGPGWQCAACGELGEPQFTQCWRCGADRP